MSLQVWLPLTGDLHNQGLKNISVSSNNSSVSTNGKIGSCMKITSNTDLGYSHDFNTTGVSFGGWFKFNKSEISSVVSNLTYNSTANSPTGNLIGNNYYGGIGLIWTGNNYYSSNNFSSMTIQSILRTNSTIQNTSGFYVDFDVWVHIFLTWDPDAHALNLYKNGILFNTKTSVEFSDGVTKNILLNYNAIWGGNGPSASIPMYCNDIRIYDHALSPLEVKHLAKGLVLHYPLAMPGQENIIANTSHEIACTYPASGVKDYYSVKTKSVPNETQYTLSFEARSTVDGDHLRTHFYSPNTTTTCESSQGIIKTASDGNMDFTLTTEWRRYWVVYTQTETTAIKSVICPRLCSPASYPSSQSGTGTVYVRNQKLERGPHPTPWIPNPSDTEYSILGFNDGIEYDVSGYNHNGTKVGVVVASADTPRYSTSSLFDGSSYIINNTSTIHLSNEFTIAWWGKVNSWQKKWEGMFLLQNTPALNSASGTYSIANAIHASTAGLMTLTLRQGGTTYPFDHYNWTYTVGVWSHYACTYKDGVIIMYQNGAQVYTATIDNNSSGDYYYTIGKRVSNCNCQMSDFRIYATALSADDVMALYKNAGYVDSDGNVYAYEMAE